QMMAAAEKQQIIDQLDLAKAQAEIAAQQAEAEERKASALLKQAQAYKAISDADSRAADVEGNLMSRDFDSKMRVVETAIDATEREQQNDDRNSDSGDS
ncbi:hypothetical protein RZS08_20650, partial [Arthrospira platensis SPKY1]|nr:hypothetical protein [Arthrospira platensis SPKY1]